MIEIPGYKIYTVPSIYKRGREPIHFTIQKGGWAEHWIFDTFSGVQLIDYLKMRDMAFGAKERLDAKIKKTGA